MFREYKQILKIYSGFAEEGREIMKEECKANLLPFRNGKNDLSFFLVENSLFTALSKTKAEIWKMFQKA